MQFARGVLRKPGSGSATSLHSCASRGRSAAPSPSALLVGRCFALYLRYVGREVSLVLIAVCTLLSHVGSSSSSSRCWRRSPRGWSSRICLWLRATLWTAVQRGAPPVLVVFFVAVGASLSLDAVAAVGHFAIALALIRLRASTLGPRIGRACRPRPSASASTRGPDWFTGWHHPWVRVGCGGGVSGLGRRCSAARGAHCHPRACRPLALPSGAARGGRD